MEDKDKIWFNRTAMKVLPFVLFFLTAILAHGYIVFKKDIYNDGIFVIIANGIMSLIFIIPSLLLAFFGGMYIIYVLANNGMKIKIKNFRYLKKVYNINLIPYNNKLKTHNLQIDKNYYCRNLPCNKDLLLVYWISYQYNITSRPQDFIGAVLLKLIKDNNINVLEKDNGECYLDINKIVKCEYEYEYMLLDILKSAAVNGILKEQEFKNWCSNNYKSISSWYGYSLKVEEEKLINNGLIKKETIAKNMWYGQTQIKLNIIVETDELQLIVKNLIGLKQYLLNFSTIKDKEIIDVHLWEYYLIYAKIFGIANKVKNEFKDIYPDFIDLFDNLSVKLVLDKNGYVDVC